jgi:hypothetical protein
MNQKYPTLILAFIFSCNFQNEQVNPDINDPAIIEPMSVAEISLPEGYSRVHGDEDSFTNWLRSIKLKKDKQVYLYDGTLKKRQTAQFAVMDIPVGEKNLQQCADAVIRLRAEYLYAKKRFNEISFSDNDSKEYKWEQKDNRPAFEKYLEMVFGWCGSASLEKQLKPITDISRIEPGDVFIKGGFPGHAMIIMDVAVNAKGEKMIMLAQSYMPAQDIHIVKNPMNEKLSPWYEVNRAEIIITPEWKFYKNQLREW